MAYYYYTTDIAHIQLHYYLTDESHSMNALIQNKSELELIKLMFELGRIFELEFSLETEALAQGGIRRWFKIALKNENKKATITIGVLTGIFIAAIGTPITTSVAKTTEMVIERIFEDEADVRKEELEIEGIELENENKKLRNEHQRLENEKLRGEVMNSVQKIDSSQKIKKYKSNYYEQLEKEKKIEKISFTSEDVFKRPLSNEYYISKNEFKNFILATNEIESEPIEDAIIEIISPVLKKGNYKWKGIYNGNAISFNMKSNEFKTLVQTGKVEFKNGSAINCVLETTKELTDDGEEKVSEYNIVRVNYYFENDKPIETFEGKRQRQIKEANENQFNLFDENPVA